MLDFAASHDDGSTPSCRNVYGYILERALGINHTVCGGRGRDVALYSSESNLVEIHIQSEAHVMLKYIGKLLDTII